VGVGELEAAFAGTAFTTFDALSPHEHAPSVRISINRILLRTESVSLQTSLSFDISFYFFASDEKAERAGLR
jgi:hypothetical protein